MKLKAFVCLGVIAFLGSLGPAVEAQTFSVIHNFTGTGGDGAYPTVGVTVRGGTLFGTTADGGVGDKGMVYQVNHVGSNWITAPIFWFPTDNSGGYQPQSPVRFGADGHLYGTTFWGGEHKDGVAFYLTPPASICKAAACFWKETVLYSFVGEPDGMAPTGPVSWDSQNNAYGTTSQGGTANLGSVYQLTKTVNGWTETPIHTFTGKPDGDSPNDGVIVDANGNLYGTTSLGGQYGYGTVYKLSYVNGNWTETILYNFQNSNLCDGELPLGGLTMDSSGNLYGSSSANVNACAGTSVFELKRSNDTYTFRVLYNMTHAAFQCGPQSSLTLDAAGNLYGTSECDGEFGRGNVFRLTNTENGWIYRSLHAFNGNDGMAAGGSGVTIAPDGTLYGTTRLGGSLGIGTIWMIKP